MDGVMQVFQLSVIALADDTYSLRSREMFELEGRLGLQGAGNFHAYPQVGRTPLWLAVDDQQPDGVALQSGIQLLLFKLLEEFVHVAGHAVEGSVEFLDDGLDPHGSRPGYGSANSLLLRRIEF